jgi:subfamily B ATP-binding cassette protein MsbA
VFKDIEYTHNSAKEKLFDKLNLKIRPFEKIAMLGRVGSGKSSCSSLLSRIQTFQGGDIYINDMPITEIEINDLREKIVYIPQSPKLFNRTLWENISYGLDKTITPEYVLNFIKECGLDEIETLFRKRMNDKVGKGGSKMSGGQKQIIWIIRAILKDSKVIQLDEPTAALDPSSKQHIKKMIDIMSKNRTIILITHDMDMTQNFDRIITFEKGKIISDKLTNKNSNNNNKNSNNNNNNKNSNNNNGWN